MRFPFTIFAIVLLLAIAALQALRLWLGLDVEVAGVPVPGMASAILMIVAILLAVFLWIEIARGRDRRADREISRSGRPGQAGTRAATRARPKPVWVINGQRQPADYFLFASRGITAKQVRNAAEKYERIMVGFDAGNIPQSTLSAARDVGAELEIYVEGPGGPTGNAWSPDERARVKKASASVGINTKGDKWMKEWDAWGWKAYTFKQLEAFLAEGYTAGEIDNLGRVLGEGTDKLIEFFAEYGEKCVAGRLPRLIMKNISEDQLEAVVAAVKDGTLPRAMFSEFHISERGSGDRKRQEALSSQIGIRTVASNDTFNYDAFGEFGLKTQYAALVPAQAESGTTDIAASDTGQMPLQTAAATVAADTITRPG